MRTLSITDDPYRLTKRPCANLDSQVTFKEQRMPCLILCHKRFAGVFVPLARLIGICAIFAGMQMPNSVVAQDSPTGARALANRAGFTTETGQPKDFVVKTRPTTTYEYPVVTPLPADRAVPNRSPAELQDLQSKLDQARNRSASFAKRPAPRSTFGNVQEARRAAIAARARANRPIYIPGGVQPTSVPVPESRRSINRRPTNPLAIPRDE